MKELHEDTDCQSHEARRDDDIPCIDSIESERSLLVEIEDSEKEAGDESEIISDKPTLRRCVVPEVFTKCWDICCNEKRDRDMPDHIVIGFDTLCTFLCNTS